METERDNISIRVASFACYLDTAKDAVSAQAQQPSVVSGKPMSHASNPPLISTGFSHSKRIIPNFRVDSFSYNRNLKAENSVFESPGPVQDPTSAFSFSHEIPTKEGEISVFGADRYFSMKLEYQTRVKDDHENQRPADLIGIESKIKPRTPSLCSEATSLNSQSALLSSALHRKEESSRMKQTKRARRRIFSRFNCQGPCFDNNAVRIKDLVSIPPENDPTVDKKKLNVPSNFEESRNSIEVFGSSETNRSKGSDIAADMERKLSMLTWDAIPIKTSQNRQTSTTTVSSTVCDDMASDASSDLFEIENVSGTLLQLHHPMLTSPKEDNDTILSSCMSPVYAPSEASIQWSVVTASAADYSSAVSDYYNDARNVIEKDVQKSKKSSSGGVSLLLGCKNQKTVDVAENVCCNKKG